MEQWEYKIMYFSSQDSVIPGKIYLVENEEKILNKLGEDGWEITGVADGGAKVYLKRRK